MEQSAAPEEPYKPKPVLNISFGTLFGLVLAGGFISVRERMDSSIKSPGASRRMFNAPDSGVIPNLGASQREHQACFPRPTAGDPKT